MNEIFFVPHIIMEKYHATKETLQNVIEEYGVAIIPNVLSPNELEEFKNGAVHYFKHITQDWENKLDNIFDTSTQESQNKLKSFYDLYPSHGMLIQHWNIGHAQFVWDLRQNPKIVELFSHFWKCDSSDLLVSFDGVSLNPPPEITRKGWRRKHWLHTDQSYTRNEFECIQSWITAFDVNPEDATLEFMEKSHKYHQDFAQDFKKEDKSDWYKLTDEETNYYLEKGCSIERISCPAGSMVFWDSRTIHCGSNALKTRKEYNYRLVVYLCYMPRSQATQKELKKKQKAFQELRMTSHWPVKSKLFSKNPRTYGGKLPTITNIDSPVLTELGKKLSGF